MSTHSYSSLWIHLIWETLRRGTNARQEGTLASTNMTNYARDKNIYMKINFFNADHTHALFDLPTDRSIEQVIQLFKGSSSQI